VHRPVRILVGAEPDPDLALVAALERGRQVELVVVVEVGPGRPLRILLCHADVDARQERDRWGGDRRTGGGDREPVHGAGHGPLGS
jgi:hypothetical protein